MFGDSDDEDEGEPGPFHLPKPLPRELKEFVPQTATAPQPTRRLPTDLLNPLTPSKPNLNTAKYFKLVEPVSLEYKKDFIPGGSKPNQFDVLIPVQRSLPCILLRYDSNDPLKYDRRMSIEIDKLQTGLPYIDITATNPYTNKPEGTYTFPLTTTNTESFNTIKSAAIVSV
jgi:hypothetical protein